MWPAEVALRRRPEMAPKKPRRGRQARAVERASTGAVDAGKIDVDKIAAELDHQIHLQSS